MEWNWPTWTISVGAVVVSGLIAWLEGNWTRRSGLGMGFVDHGGMWGDLVLLPIANAAIAPHLTFGPWLAVAILGSAAASVIVHRYWYSPAGHGDHMWPRHTHGRWVRDLSWSGWAHVAYVIGELTLLAGFVTHDVPPDVVLLVAAIFTVHVPIGLLQPRFFLSGHIATAGEQPLLLPCLVALWAVVATKL